MECEIEKIERDGKENEWSFVRNNRKTKEGSRFNTTRNSLVKFYVSDIPEGCCLGDLAVTLKEFGDFGGVYIVQKRNKEGARFGFIKFKGVKDAKEMEKNLGKVRMGNTKLKINVARYTEENKTVEGRFHGKNMGMNSNNSIPQVWYSGFSRKGVSFKDVVTGNRDNMEKGMVIVVDPNIGDTSGNPKKAFVCKCMNLGALISLKEALVVAGFVGFHLSYVGGLGCLINFESELAAKDFLNKKTVWRGWFLRLEEWSSQSLAFERTTWIKVARVPFHLAKKEVFNMIGEKFGKVV